MSSIGRILLTLVGITTSTGCYIADFSKTHVYNPNWPPHAKFHNGQTMSMGLCLGLLTLYHAWKPSANLREAQQTLRTTAIFASLYWITQLSAILYPGSKAIDPEFGDGFPQFWICTVLLSTVGAGYWLESGRLSNRKISQA